MAAGRTAGRLSRLLGRGGSAVPGLVAEKLHPRLIEELAASVGDVVVVTGTNGKTTTTKMLVGILSADGTTVLTNATGSNLARGVATCLIEAASRSGVVDASVAVLEVDEAAVRAVAARLTPRVMVVTNLARDQLDRYGELATTAGHIAEALRHADTAILNADDPMVAALAGADVRWFGASEEIRASMPSDHSLYGGTTDGRPMPRLDVRLDRVVSTGDGQAATLVVDGMEVAAHLQVPGAYNGYNAAAAVLAAGTLGIDAATSAAALAQVEPAFGRGQVIEYRGRRVKLVLIKNPAGFNQAIRLLTDLADEVPVLIAINDNHADGRDVSWLWDAQVEDLGGSRHRFATSGIRALDMAVRLKYAGIEAWAEAEIDAGLERFIDEVPRGQTAYIVPTYTAMLDLVALLMPDLKAREAWS